MRVLHVTPSYFPASIYGGPIQSTHELNLALARLGATVRVLTTDANGPQRLAESGSEVSYSGVVVHYMPRVMRPDISFSLLTRLIADVRWADVVHLTAVYSFSTIPTLAACKLLGKPLFWSPRGAFQQWQGSPKQSLKAIWDVVGRMAAPRRTTVIAASEREALAARQRYPKVSAEIVGNGVHVPDVLRTRTESDILRIVFLGRLHPIKGLEELIDACGLLCEKGIAFQLSVAGGGDAGYIAALRERAQSRGVESQVHFLGQIEPAAKAHLFSASDILVLPSHSENFGMVVVEALAHAVPVVASKNTPWQALEAKECGLWTENDPASIAAAMERLRSMDRRRMGMNGRAWMSTEFTWAKQAQKVYCLYEDAIANADR